MKIQSFLCAGAMAFSESLVEMAPFKNFACAQDALRTLRGLEEQTGNQPKSSEDLGASATR
jgi:hypothetical protein